MQTTNKVFMVIPTHFSFNDETACNNEFQKKSDSLDTNKIAKEESIRFINLLKEAGIEVIAVEDTMDPITPDSVFPNNWFSTHDDGTFVLYPMFAKNRREERKDNFIQNIKQNFPIKKTIDLSFYENQNEFLEGTGSMVLDRENKIIYACSSPRTSKIVLDDLAKQLGYQVVLFSAYGKTHQQIYHTNVMMSIGTQYACVCLESITDKNEKMDLLASLEKTNKHIIDITLDQLEHFCGNILELKGKNYEPILVMSDTAYHAFTLPQLAYFEQYYKIIHPVISCIEENGGGSARCMLGELF